MYMYVCNLEHMRTKLTVNSLLVGSSDPPFIYKAKVYMYITCLHPYSECSVQAEREHIYIHAERSTPGPYRIGDHHQDGI